MAGIVSLYEGKEGGINIGSTALLHLYDFLIEFKNISPILAEDTEFDPQSDLEGIPGMTNYLNLAEISEISIAEIKRQLDIVIDPDYDFWKNYDRFYDEKFLNGLREQGKDVDEYIREAVIYYRDALRQVSELIHERLENHPS